MSVKCPVCSQEIAYSDWEDRPDLNDGIDITCKRCGVFFVTRTAIQTLPSTLQSDQDAAIKISHYIRKIHEEGKKAELTNHIIPIILEQPLPTPPEQVDLIIRWLAEGENGLGSRASIVWPDHQALIGAITEDHFHEILRYLNDSTLVNGEPMGGGASFALSFEGWEYYNELKQGATASRTAFMAMKFGEPNADRVYSEVFRPAVEKAGFRLTRLDEKPEAGSIDNRLRAEIQSCAFLIADLSHANNGAYWEAGYAEGLGKPVIYTCEKSVFDGEDEDNPKPHFDVNHHLTIIWDKDSPEQAGENLKYSIRATLPHLAKMVDDEPEAIS